MVNRTFIRQSAPDIRRKLQKLDDAFAINPSQLADIDFRVFNEKERKQRKEGEKRSTTFLDPPRMDPWLGNT